MGRLSLFLSHLAARDDGPRYWPLTPSLWIPSVWQMLVKTRSHSLSDDMAPGRDTCAAKFWGFATVYST